MLPLAAPCGSTTIVYVPVEGSSVASTKPPNELAVTGPTSVAPFGFRIVIRAEQQVGPTERLTRCPFVPPNVRRAFCPGTAVATVTAGPPGTIVPDASAGTSKSANVMPPVAAPWRSATIVYVPVGGRLLAARKPPNVAVRVSPAAGTSTTTGGPPGRIAVVAAPAGRETASRAASPTRAPARRRLTPASQRDSRGGGDPRPGARAAASAPRTPGTRGTRRRGQPPRSACARPGRRRRGGRRRRSTLSAPR